MDQMDHDESTVPRPPAQQPPPGPVGPTTPPPPGSYDPPGSFNAPPPSGQPPPYAPMPNSPPPYGQPVPYGQPMPYGQPPFGPTGEPFPVKKKRKIWPWILGVCLVFVLLIGGCSVLLFRAVKGPIDASNEFLAHIQDRDFDEAFRLVDPACFTDEQLAEIERYFTEQRVTSYDLDSTSFENSTGEASGTVTLNGNDERDIAFQLENDDGWKVCRLDISAG